MTPWTLAPARDCHGQRIGWHLQHRPSGCGVGWTRTRAGARALARALDLLPIDWRTAAPLDGAADLATAAAAAIIHGHRTM